MYLNKQIEELCNAVSREADGEKLLSLVDELNKELEHEAETQPKNGLLQPSQSARDDAQRLSQPDENREAKSSAA